ncbi:hypothetical protein [Paraburkholderia sp. DGU8]|uniref:hypothetical protein n=1 Tax=Paraburkholderia sp. DGU8 TaxID=3161997 RepID=UPI00346612ED
MEAPAQVVLKTASVFPLRTRDGGKIPILVVDDSDGAPKIVPEVTALMRNLSSTGASFSKMRGIAVTLAFLHEYFALSLHYPLLLHSELPNIISDFLRKRRNGSSSDDGLDWTPVKRETVDRDRIYLREFSEFCSLQYGYFPLITTGTKDAFGQNGTSFKDVMRSLARNKTRLLAHLQFRQQQKRRQPSTEVNLPERRIYRRTSRGTFLSLPMIEDLISSTPSVVQKMVFIQASFGGPRISEILNMWRCDVLPGSYRPHLFPDDKPSDVPLLVIAHPSQSRYVGGIRPSSVDRLQHLSQDYNLAPRNLLDADSLRSGWKGMLYDNDALLISQIFWANKAWALIYYQLFQELRATVISNLPAHIRNSHPYLYINDSLSRAEFGQPLKMSNIRKAFARACGRIGVDASRFKEGIHGLRHAYKAMLNKLGLSPEEIRIAMHHVSAVTQEDYGRSAARLNERLILAHNQDNT